MSYVNGKHGQEKLSILQGITSFVYQFCFYWNVTHYRKYAKRYWDVASAATILIFTSPLFILLSILIKLDSKGPVFYTQKRIGKNGKVFYMFKFRTMQFNSDYQNPQTIDNDPRITRIGKLIRPISLDELPQLLNILKGEMSFIGPRPLSVEDYRLLRLTKRNIPSHILEDLKPQVLPGILGWAIFQGREKITVTERYNLNKEYERRQSLLFDTYISWLTLKKYWLSYLIVIITFISIPVSILLFM